MRKSSLSLSVLSALAVAGIMATPSTIEQTAQVTQHRGGRHSAQSRTLRRPGRVYPEQSSRQAMRGHRRAQGGAGIELINGRYEASGRESYAL